MSRDTYDMFAPPARGRFGDNERAIGRSNAVARGDRVDLMLCRHHATDRAILVSLTGEEVRAVWLPTSQIAMAPAGRSARGRRRTGQVVNLDLVAVTLPRRMAEEKGLL